MSTPVTLVAPRHERLALDPVCISCTRPEDDPNTVAVSTHWKVVLHPDQTVPAAVLLVSRRHARRLGDLDEIEAAEMTGLIATIEAALEREFGATMVNFSCLRNWAFRASNPIPPFLDGAPNPHVHWHVAPRYAQPVTIHGETFVDADFGNELRWTARSVTADVLAAIHDRLLTALGLEASSG